MIVRLADRIGNDRQCRKWVPRFSRRVPHESHGTVAVVTRAIPLEFEVDKRGRATDVPVPLDLTSLKFLGKMALTVPLLVALAAHLAEPGLLTKDKSKNQ